MTLEQAINHLEEELKIKEDWSCVACKEEHEQLLSWLKELQAIKEAKPSEALMFIQELLNISETEKHFINLANYNTRLNLIKTKQALVKAQEQEKILGILKRIIKVKPSDLYEFELVVRGTDEEENTIKEWLEKNG